MQPVDPEIVSAALDWEAEGKRSTLATVLATFGSAPRPIGAMVLIREDGRVFGSVSGGCVEDDLTEQLRTEALSQDRCGMVTYGGDAEQQARFGLPCGGVMRLWVEPAPIVQFRRVAEGLAERRLMLREIDVAGGHSSVRAAQARDVTALDGTRFTLLLGPRHRLLIIGAGDVARHLAPVAVMLGYRVEVCDPRPEHVDGWSVPGISPVRAMPDDYLLQFPAGPRCAVVTTSHDPKLDDLALIEALRSEAFYVGALGSIRTTEARKHRLAEHFGLAPRELARLHGPVGLDIGSRTPPEIAVAIAAEIVKVQRAAETTARRRAPAAGAPGTIDRPG